MVRIIVWNPNSVSCGGIKTLKKYSRKLEIINRHSIKQKLIIYPKDDNKSIGSLMRILNMRKNIIGLEYKILTDDGKERGKGISEKRLEDFRELMRQRKVKKVMVKIRDSDLTINEKLIKQFLGSREYSKRTIKDYQWILSQFVNKYGMSLNDLTIKDIIRYSRQLRKNELNQTTIDNRKKILRYFLMWKIRKQVVRIIRNNITTFLDK